MDRRTFLAATASLATAYGATPKRRKVQTVRGEVEPRQLGTALVHEHVLVDFIGAERVSRSRYSADEVFAAALPRLKSLYAAACRTLVDCTPAYLGRDTALLRRLSESSGLHIVTNTGLYAANKERHVPRFAFQESAEPIARRWLAEYNRGIDGTGIKPGFIKIGVDAGPLTEIGAKLVSAGCVCQKWTGLRLHIHTGNGAAALGILHLLGQHDVPAAAYVWVHAQTEKDRSIHVKLAQAGSWLEFDGVGPRTLEDHVTAVTDLIARGYLRQLLVSQDSGWFHVGEPNGGTFNGYTYLFEEFVPKLRAAGIGDGDIRTLLSGNPARVLTWE
jgi:phosphotriesterase-related protein